jgi:hypothetical protein
VIRIQEIWGRHRNDPRTRRRCVAIIIGQGKQFHFLKQQGLRFPNGADVALLLVPNTHRVFMYAHDSQTERNFDSRSQFSTGRPGQTQDSLPARRPQTSNSKQSSDDARFKGLLAGHSPAPNTFANHDCDGSFEKYEHDRWNSRDSNAQSFYRSKDNPQSRSSTHLHSSKLDAPVAPSQMKSKMSQMSYETLPRDCVVMLLEGALKCMPQETDAVVRCMRALGPLTREEYIQCFGGAPRELPGAGNSFDASHASHAIPHIEGMDTDVLSPARREQKAPVYHGGGVGCSNGGSVGLPSLVGLGLAWPCSKQPMTSSPHIHSTPSDCSMTDNISPGLGGEQGSSCSNEICRTVKVNKVGTRRSVLLTDSRAGTRTSILTEEQAIEIFKEGPSQRSERASKCSKLAHHYNITTTAIRHIWDRRTWVWTTMPFWSKEEMAESLVQGRCESCRCKGVDKIDDTCELCPINRKRGRPRGARDNNRDEHPDSSRRSRTNSVGHGMTARSLNTN